MRDGCAQSVLSFLQAALTEESSDDRTYCCASVARTDRRQCVAHERACFQALASTSMTSWAAAGGGKTASAAHKPPEPAPGFLNAGDVLEEDDVPDADDHFAATYVRLRACCAGYASASL